MSLRRVAKTRQVLKDSFIELLLSVALLQHNSDNNDRNSKTNAMNFGLIDARQTAHNKDES